MGASAGSVWLESSGGSASGDTIMHCPLYGVIVERILGDIGEGQGSRRDFAFDKAGRYSHRAAGHGEDVPCAALFAQGYGVILPVGHRQRTEYITGIGLYGEGDCCALSSIFRVGGHGAVESGGRGGYGVCGGGTSGAAMAAAAAFVHADPDGVGIEAQAGIVGIVDLIKTGVVIGGVGVVRIGQRVTVFIHGGYGGTYPDAVEFLPLGDLFPGANKALTEEGFLHVFPQIYDCEGFFVARLRKTQAIPALPAPKYKVGNFPFSPVKDREAGQIRQATAGVGLNWDENLRLWQRDKELWLFPVGIEALIGKVRFSRLGIKLAETHNKGYRWQHEAVIALASPDNMNAFELTPQEAEEWYRGRDVYPQAAPVADDVLVTFQHQPIGLAKRIGSRLKNSYPRELVRDGKLFTGNA